MYVFLIVLLIGFVLALPFIIIRHASRRYKREIARVKADSAVQYRALIEQKREAIILRTKRITDTIYVLILIAAIVFFIVAWIIYGWDSGSLWILLIVAYDLYAYKHNYQLLLGRLRGHVSHMKADELLSMDTPFALYLRGFQDDSYSNSYKERDFNELYFSRVVREQLGLSMYAIGMTKELDSPIGAERVYVDDDSWKEKVLLLIEKAARIYILVNNRESCLWEMQQVVPYLDKAVFIVNDRRCYSQVKEALAPYFNFPDEVGVKADHFFFNSKMIPVPFHNRERDYVNIVLNPDELFAWEEQKKQEEAILSKNESQKNTRLEKLIYGVVIIGAVILLVFMIFH